MKLRNLLFIATAACAGLFSACSNEIEMDEASKGDNTETVAGEAYATFSFVMPSGSGASGRSITNVDGTSEENNITTVNFLLYNADGTLFTNIAKVRADFTPVSVNGATRYTLKDPANIATAGTYSVHVILNPASALTPSEIGTLDAYKVYTEKVAQKTGIYCTPNTFMMTNADAVKTVKVDAANTKTNPALITVNVERLAAKISFNNAANNSVDITGLGTVAFDAYKVINTRNSAYKLRRVGESATSYTIGAPEEATKYVIENLFAEKAGFNDNFFKTNYSRRLDTYVAFRNLKTSEGIQDIAYALENTHAKTQDLKKGLITGVIFRGKVTLNENTLIGEKQENGTFYKYNGKYYASLETMKDKLAFDFKYEEFKGEVGTGEAVDTEAKYLTLISNNKAFLYNKFRIELFAKGYAYYYYWLRHNDDGKADEAGIMEHAMVRNNVYQLKINSVSNVGGFESGTPGPADTTKPDKGQADVEDGGKNPEILGEVSTEQEPTTPVVPVKPTDPVFETDMYLNVEILVKQWTVRDTPVDL